MRRLRPFAALLTAALILGTVLPAAAHKAIHTHVPYAHIIGRGGVVFTLRANHEDGDDILVAATSPSAGMTMIMNDAEDADGVMQMREGPEGFAVKTGATRLLTNVSAHNMLSDLSRKFKPGDTVPISLIFLHAGDVTDTVQADNLRPADPGTAKTTHVAMTAAIVDGASDHTAPAHDRGNIDVTKPAA